MRVEKYRHEEDCRVERAEKIGGPVAELYDSEGDKVWTFPDSFTDEQIMASLAFANHAFKVGISTSPADTPKKFTIVSQYIKALKQRKIRIFSVR